MNITAFVFLIFSSAVAFIRILLGEWAMGLLPMPFIAAYLVKGKLSRWLEFCGIYGAGLATLIMGNLYIGMLILFVSTIWFLVYIDRSIKAWAMLTITALCIGIITYIEYDISTPSRLVSAILNIGLYSVGAVLLRITLNHLIQSVRAEMLNIDKKKLDLIEKLQGALHEAIDTLKMDASDANKPRTHC